MVRLCCWLNRYADLAYILLLTLVFALVVVARTRADDPTARARAALALAVTGPAPAPGCGTCRDDYPGCVRDTLGAGRPLVLFVGGCRGRGAELADLGAVLCRVSHCSLDGGGATPRVLVVARSGWRLVVTATLPATATPHEIAAAVEMSPVAAGSRLDWR